MYCRNCGKEIKEGAKFCTGCGSPVNGTDTTAVFSSEQGDMEKQPASKFKWYVPVVSVAAVIIAVAVVGGIWFFMSSLEKRDAQKTGDLLAEDIKTKDSETAGSKQKDPETDDSQTKGSEPEHSEPKASEPEEITKPATEDTQKPEPEKSVNGIALLSADTLEGLLQQKIIALNSLYYREAIINVYTDNYTPGTRDLSATWDDTVFYCLEGYQTTAGYVDKNSCALIKKEMRNAQTGNIVQYDIYVNPSNGIFNKIVSIEYLEDGLEITEYYYDNFEKVNFIFQYNTDNYISTSAASDKEGERYFFKNDCMVTWRNISEHGTLNFVVGREEAERMKHQFSQNTMWYYNDLTEEQAAGVNTQERKMLNAAYNTYNKVRSSEGIAHIQGYVYDGKGNGLGGAFVNLYASDFSTKIYSVETDASGMYMIYLPNQEYEYNVSVQKNGMGTADIYQIAMNSEQIGVYQDSTFLFDESNESANVKLVLGDAYHYAADGNGMVRLSDAVVSFRQGINNRTGSFLWQGVADNNGNLLVNLKPGVYTVEVDAANYETMFYTVVANPLENVSTYEFYATEKLNDGEYAVVLTWGEYPYDLDSHLFTTAGTQTEHIWYGGPNDAFNNFLDVDDTTSYGPETVTISRFSASSYYKYCVVDYTNCVSENYNSKQMSNSMACVKVYSSEGLIATYYVPSEKKGVIWEVFEIRNGHITPIQRYYNNVEDKTWWHRNK